VTRATAARASTRPVPPRLERKLTGIAKRAGVTLKKKKFREYAVQPPRSEGATTSKARRRTRKPLGGRRFYMAMQKPRGAPAGPHAVAIVVKSVRGRIVDVRTYRQR
jgi:hypothetical protein